MGFTLGVPSFSLSSWKGDAISAPQPLGLGITVYYVIEGRLHLRHPTLEGGSRPRWWFQAMAYAYAGSTTPPPRAVPPDTRALVLICQCPVHVPRGDPATAPPPVQICVKRGDRYTPVDTASMDLADHRATLAPPGRNALAITTPMVARATYDRARGRLVVVPSALGAQQLRDAHSKGWSAWGVSYARALQPAKPVGFKVLGAQAPALRDWVLSRLTGQRPAGTPSLTTVFGLIGHDLRTAQEAASGSARNAEPPGGPAPSEPDPEPEHPGPSQTQN